MPDNNLLRMIDNLERSVREIAVAVLAEQPGRATDESVAIKARVAKIQARGTATAADAAFLLGCSPNHIRNLVKKARQGHTPYPIPYLDLDGVAIFPVPALMEWAARPKLKVAS